MVLFISVCMPSRLYTCYRCTRSALLCMLSRTSQLVSQRASFPRPAPLPLLPAPRVTPACHTPERNSPDGGNGNSVVVGNGDVLKTSCLNFDDTRVLRLLLLLPLLLLSPPRPSSRAVSVAATLNGAASSRVILTRSRLCPSHLLHVRQSALYKALLVQLLSDATWASEALK